MPANVYHFEDHWFVPFSAAAVWEVLAKASRYPEWWKGVYLSAQALDGEEPKVGRRVAVVAKGFLPYKLRFTIETSMLEKPSLIGFKASGDFITDASRWILTSQEHGTAVTLDWNPRVEKGVVRLLSPVVRPLFRANHNWTMRVGQREIVKYMRAQGGPKV